MLNPKEIITESYNLYKNNAKPLLKLVLFFGILVFFEAIASAQVSTLELWGFGPLLVELLIQLPFGLAAILISIMLIYNVDALANKKFLKLVQALKLSLKKIWPVLLASILVAILTAVGLIALIAPGVYLWVTLAFTTYIVIFEDKKIKEAIKESREMSRGRFWKVFTRLLLPNLFWAFTGWLIANIINNVFNITGFENLAKNSSAWTTVFFLVSTVSNSAVNAFFIPLFTTVTYLLYKDLKK